MPKEKSAINIKLQQLDGELEGELHYDRTMHICLSQRGLHAGLGEKP